MTTRVGRDQEYILGLIQNKTLMMVSDADTGGLRNGNNETGSNDHLDAGAVPILESKGFNCF